MNKWLKVFGIGVALASPALNLGLAQAALIATYDFGSSGELVGQGGGTGWSTTAWGGNATVSGLISAPTNFFYDVPGGGTVSATGAVQFSGNNTNAIYRPLDASESNSDIYISFLLQFSAGSISGNDFSVWWFSNNITTDHQTDPNIGIKADQGITGVPSNKDFMARLNSPTPPLATAYAPDQLTGPITIPLTPAPTYFVVGHLYKEGSSSNYNRYSIWVNPSYQDASSPEAIAQISTGGLSSFLNVGVRTATLSGSDRVLMGTLRIGTTWRDVVPVPEPGTLALLGLGLAGFGLGARSRRAKR